MKLFVKNMVCDRCKMVVKAGITMLGFNPISVALGIVDLKEDHLSTQQLGEIKQHLQQLGFELLEDKERQIVEQIKTTIIELIHRDNDDSTIKNSGYIAQRVGKDYPYLSKLFSEVEGTTIEQYIILQKIEKVKELLAYDEQTLSEIAWQMGYSSVAALSSQFKKVVGMNPSRFREAKNKNRTELDKIGKVK